MLQAIAGPEYLIYLQTSPSFRVREWEIGMTKQFRMKTLVSLVSSMIMAGAGSVSANQDPDVLPDAKSGECYAKVLVPPVYKTETVSAVVKEATESLTIIPAKYTSSSERVLVKAESTTLTAVQPEFEEVSKKVQISAAETRWVRDSLKGEISVSAGTMADLASSGINPADARPGQCFYEHFKPGSYKTAEERIMTSAASESLDVVPAEFTISEKQIMTKAASKRLVEVPAVFKTVEEKVLIEPAKKVWKKGAGPIQKIDHATGEIMCLVDVPAVYETVSKRAVAAPPLTTSVVVPAEFKKVSVQSVKTAASEVRRPIPAEYTTIKKTERASDGSLSWVADAAGSSSIHGKHTGNVVCLRETPAEFETITQRIVKTPGRFTTASVAAEYTNVPVRKLVSDATVSKLAVPEEKKSFVKRLKVSDARLEWRPVLCETNMTDTTVIDIQRALSSKGYNPGSIDGVLGRGTMLAIEKFQKSNNLAQGGLTYPTLDALGIKL